MSVVGADGCQNSLGMLIKIIVHFVYELFDDFRVARAELVAPRAVFCQSEPLRMRHLVLFAWLDITAPAMTKKVSGRSNLTFIAPQPILGPGTAMPDQPADGLVIRLIAPF